MPRPGGRKYQPLADFLTAQPSDEVRLSFAQIEDRLADEFRLRARVDAEWDYVKKLGKITPYRPL